MRDDFAKIAACGGGSAEVYIFQHAGSVGQQNFTGLRLPGIGEAANLDSAPNKVVGVMGCRGDERAGDLEGEGGLLGESLKGRKDEAMVGKSRTIGLETMEALTPVCT